jgi:hypothetical protein
MKEEQLDYLERIYTIAKQSLENGFRTNFTSLIRKAWTVYDRAKGAEGESNE